MATRGCCLTIHVNVVPNKLLSQSTYMTQPTNGKKEKHCISMNVSHEEYKSWICNDSFKPYKYIFHKLDRVLEFVGNFRLKFPEGIWKVSHTGIIVIVRPTDTTLPFVKFLQAMKSRHHERSLLSYSVCICGHVHISIYASISMQICTVYSSGFVHVPACMSVCRMWET